MAQHNSGEKDSGGHGLPELNPHVNPSWLGVTLHSIGDAVIVADRKSNVTFLNPVAESLSGWSSAEAVGQPLETVFRIVNEQTRQPAENPVVKALREGTVVGLANHTVLVGKDGTERPIDNSAAPIRDADGNLTGVVLVFRDITARRKAEHSLRESEQRFRALANAAPMLIWMSGPDKEGIYFNQTWLDFTGKPAEQQLGEGWLDLVHPEDRQPLFDICTQAFRSRQPFTTEFRLRRHDGQYRYMLDTGTPRIDPNGSFLGFIGSCVDIEDRNQAEQFLRDNEQRLRLALEAGRMGTWEWNIETSELIWSPGLELIHGLQPGTFSGTFEAYQKDIHPDDRERVVNSIARTLSRGGAHHVEYRIIWPDGSLHWVEGKGRLFMSESGAPVRMIGVCTDITERKQLDEALQESEQRFSQFMEHLPGLSWIKDLEGRYVYANDAAQSAFRTSQEDLYGKTDQEVFPPETAVAFSENDHRAFASEAGIQTIETLEHADGILHHSIVSKFPIPGPDGRAVLIGGVAIDITDRKQAEAALAAREAELELVAKTTPIMLARCSRDLKYRFANRAAAALFGLTPDQMIDKPIIDIMGGRTFAIIKPYVDQVLRGEPVEYEAELPYGGVGPRWVRVNYIPERDAHGEVVGWIASIVDITERKRMEQSLKFLAEASKSLSSLTDYRSTLQQVARLAVPEFADWCAVDMLDAAGSLQRVAIAHMDPAKIRLAEQFYRRNPRDSAVRRGAQKVVRTGEPELVATISDAMLIEAARDEEHLRVLRELGLQSYMCVPLTTKGKTLGAMTFVSAESGRCYGQDDLVLAQELAQRAAIAVDNARLYQEVHDADRRKDEFLAMLAHELRNPLAPIRTGLDFLALDNNHNQEAIGMMQRQVQHLVRLVDDLLDVSRITRGRIELRPELVELSALINRSVDAVQPLADRQRHELVVAIGDEPIWLHVDPVRMVQVIENLLNNAIKYTDEAGRIELTAERQRGHVIVTVRDSGIGIDPELLPKVFDLFTQSTRSLDRAQGGLGIGLTLVRRLVELHNGTVAAFSEGPGCGSTFAVQLPAAQSSQGGGQEMQEHRASKGRRILVVDDNASAAMMLAMLLTKVGNHQVETALDGPSALAKIKAWRPEIALLDIGLPGMNGYEVARTVRETREFDDVLLVALTGYGQEQDRRRSQEAGFDKHMVKPIEISEVEKLLLEFPQSRG